MAKIAHRVFSRMLLAVAGAALFTFSSNPYASEQPSPGITAPGAAMTVEEIRMGERMYREGILPSGEPMISMTMGDILVDGRMFTCVSCHQRSGMGSLEGEVYTTSVYGAKLYAPLSKFDRSNKTMLHKNLPVWSGDELIRSAYTDETLARSIREGLNADGKPFDPVMPKYLLTDRETAVLIAYLKHLSDEAQPGVAEKTLRFATIVTDEVPENQRKAMLGPLQTVMNTWSRLQPTVMRAVRKGSYIDDETKKNYRKISLDVWELKGSSTTWRAQLEAYYAKQPVFAFVGGIATGAWEPIHRFCEDNRIPALFPVTDLPYLSDRNWYTLYFSEGYYQEGESAALFLNQHENVSKDSAVYQITSDEPASRALAKGFQDAWERSGHKKPIEIHRPSEGARAGEFWKKTGTEPGRSVVLLWSKEDAIPVLDGMTKSAAMPDMVFVSSRLTGSRMMNIPERMRARTYITYPYTLPQDSQRYRAGLETWLKQNRIPSSDLEIEAKMSTLLSVLSNDISMMAMRNYYHRDFFLEIVDMMKDETMNKAVVPVLSFGPGQRYAAKGCYIVQLSSGSTPTIIPRSGWVIH